jgi:restriction endonuclease Mrr
MAIPDYQTLMLPVLKRAVEGDVGVRTSRKLAFKRVDEDFFLDEE